MITIVNIERFYNTLDLYSLSTDIKPIDKIEFQGTKYSITNGSTLYEMDTKSVFLFDEENERWIQQ